MPPSLLPDELIDEIFLRLPPDEPACLVRASLASKLWRGLLTGPSFRVRYRDFHGAPPMLGFCPVEDLPEVPEEYSVSRCYFSTTKFGARIPEDKEWGNYEFNVCDCRHGRVLLRRYNEASGDNEALSMTLLLWDPMTGCRSEVYTPQDYHSHAAAVLCAVAGCDHRACHEGPSMVVSVGMEEVDDLDDLDDYFARTWSSEAGEWSKPCYALALPSYAIIEQKSTVLIRDALYLMLWYPYEEHIAFLVYELGSNTLSVIDAPLEGAVSVYASIHMAMEDGSLGFAHVDSLALNLWSRQTASDAWTQLRVIHLQELLPIQNLSETLRPVGSVEGGDIIFVTTDLDVYKIVLKSLRWKKLCKREKLRALIPYMSFYNPPGIMHALI